MVVIRIKGYDVKRVLVNQGSGVEIIYPNLYNGLNLKLEDLERYDSPLMGFDSRMVVPRGMIRLLVQPKDEEMQVDFIVVEAFFPLHGFLG